MSNCQVRHRGRSLGATASATQEEN